MPEYVILVNDHNEPIGQALKSEVHTNDTPLHRAFSVFVFNKRGELLIQQRSNVKKHGRLSGLTVVAVTPDREKLLKTP